LALFIWHFHQGNKSLINWSINDTYSLYFTFNIVNKINRHLLLMIKYFICFQKLSSINFIYSIYFFTILLIFFIFFEEEDDFFWYNLMFGKILVVFLSDIDIIEVDWVFDDFYPTFWNQPFYFNLKLTLFF
jgi:hypothetical protein